MNNEIIENCQLEWQKDRGVLYIHNRKTGGTVLRISGLKRFGRNPGTLEEGMIDVHLPSGIFSLPEPSARSMNLHWEGSVNLHWEGFLCMLDDKIIGSISSVLPLFQAFGCLKEWQDTRIGIFNDEASAKLAVEGWAKSKATP